MPDLICPFCGAKARTNYEMMHHIESDHAEPEISYDARLPNITENERSADSFPALAAEQAGLEWVECPIGCGEVVVAAEIDSHLDMHLVENDAGSSNDEDLSGAPHPHDRFSASVRRRSISPPPSRAARSGASQSDAAEESKQDFAKNAWKKLMPSVGQSLNMAAKRTPDSASGKDFKPLGRSELGPYYKENRMPTWLRELLESSDGAVKREKRTASDGSTRYVEYAPNHTRDILPVIVDLVDLDPATKYAYFCHPATVHVSKLRREGGFCGYRNIQMLSSYIIATKSQGYPHFNDKIPTIFQIQDIVERAWDHGINTQGRRETGGIIGTRKYIGTQEAQATFLELDIACDAQAFKTQPGIQARDTLLDFVEDYFEVGTTSNRKIRETRLPPLYFQHPGHSMTIIGIEKKRDGTSNLLCFDPMFGDSTFMRRHVGLQVTSKNPTDELKAYRRGDKYLRRYKDFEVLKLTPPKLDSVR